MHGGVTQILPVQVGVSEISRVGAQQIIGAYFIVFREFDYDPDGDFAVAVFIVGIGLL